MSYPPGAWPPPNRSTVPSWPPPSTGAYGGAWPPPERGRGGQGIGDHVSDALFTVRDTFVPLLVPLLLPLVAVLGIVALGLDALIGSGLPPFPPGRHPTQAEYDAFIRALVRGEGVSIVLSVMTGIVAAACYGVLARWLRGYPQMPRGELYGWAVRRFLHAIGQVILFPVVPLAGLVVLGIVAIYALGVLGVLVVLVELIVFFYLALRFGLGAAVLYADEAGAAESLHESWDLTHGRVVRMLGATIAMGILVLVVGIAINLATLAVGLAWHPLGAGLGVVVAQLVVTPLNAAFWIRLLDTFRASPA